MPKQITWVIKFSKLCNLRCKYCYEIADLHKQERISLEHCRELFLRIKELSVMMNASPKICWHGGEPMLLPHSYIDAVFTLQDDVFEGRRPLNIVQTNLTLAKPRDLEVLSRFDQVSISFDPFGEMRVNKAKKDTRDAVLTNMASLRNRGVRFGAITVLTQSSIHHIDEIFHFYNNTGVSFRLLPFYRHSNSEQIDEYGLPANEVASSMIHLIDLWFKHSRGIIIKPIDAYINSALRLRNKDIFPSWTYDKRSAEIVYVVDTNGSLYSVADTYDPEFCHGNVFADSSVMMLHSAGRDRAVIAAERRMARHCSSCSFFGACSGYDMAEATPIERADLPAEGECIVTRRCIERASYWLNIDADDKNRSPALLLPARSTSIEEPLVC